MKRFLLSLKLLFLVILGANAQVTISFTITSPTPPLTVPATGLSNVQYTANMTKPAAQAIGDQNLIIFAKQTGSSAETELTRELIQIGTWTGSGTQSRLVTGSFNISQSSLNNACGTIFARLVTYNSNEINACSASIGNNNITAPSPSSFNESGDPGNIVGTNPTGGTSYTYKWQKSTTSATTGFTDISGATLKDYNPPSVSVTTYFRRIVSSASLTDSYSNVVTVTITPGITNNLITGPSQIFFTDLGNPGIITGSTPSGGNGVFTYQWQESSTGNPSSFVNVNAAASYVDYDPSFLSTTTYYRRVVNSSGFGQSISNTICITIIGLNNIMFAGHPMYDRIFYYSRPVTPPQLVGSSITGTDKVIEYSWEESSDGTNWVNVSGNGVSYSPGSTSQDRYYRRKAILKDAGGAALYTVYTGTRIVLIADAITNNTICCNQTVYGTNTPALIIGQTALNGFSPLAYAWQMSTDNVNWGPTTGGTLLNAGRDYQPPVGLIGTYYYRRAVSDNSWTYTGYYTYSSSVQVNYTNSIPYGATITNPILTDATFSVDCLEILKSQDATAAGFSNQRGGPGKDVYFKVYGDAYLGVRSCQSSVPTKQYIYDANFNLLTPTSTYPGTSYADCFFIHTLGFTNGTYTGPNVFYIMVEGVGSDGTVNVQFTTNSYSDCLDTYMGFYWLEPGYGEGNRAMVYPNPAEGSASLKLSKSTGEEKRKISIFNKYNALVKTFETTADEINFSVEDLQPDIYIVKVEGEKKSETHRLVVK